jgi:enoyl-CoA hydratase/carnithine racemase
MSEFVKTERTKTIARATHYRLDRHSAIDETMTAEINEAFAELRKRDDVWVVVLAGEGKSLFAPLNLPFAIPPPRACAWGSDGHAAGVSMG